MRHLPLFLLLSCSAAAPDPAPAPARPMHTFSIVARDPRTGELGVAIQSHWFSVGAFAIWAEAGVGAVATQSFAEPAYGPRGLELMRSGMSAPDALQALVGADAQAAVRQVAFVDASGKVGAHTGAGCIEWAGHQTGAGYSVQANLMRNDKVVPAMAKAYEATKGDLAERLMAALEAGQAAGGDIRGKQSAAILVVRGDATGRIWEDRLVDLRVEDAADPIAELRRLLTLSRAYGHMNAGDKAVERKDMDGALRHYAAAARIAPGVIEMRYWTAVTMAANGKLAGALPIFKEVFAKEPLWIEVTRRLVKPGLLTQALVDEILARAK